MAPVASDFERARSTWRQQAATRFAVHDTQVLHRRPDATVDFAGLCAVLLAVCDQVRGRRPGERQPQDASGQCRHGDGFALIDHDGVGLFVRVRESGGDGEPPFTWFHASSVGLDGVVLAADLALLHDTTLEPIRTPEVLTVALQANRSMTDVDEVHATLARALGRVGYESARHPHLQAVDALWPLASWPAEAGAPLRRLALQRRGSAPAPTVADLMAMLARLYGELDAGLPLRPDPVLTDGRPGLGATFVLLRDASHGLKFVTDWVDLPEQNPRGTLGIAMRSGGLHDVFVSIRRVLWRDEGAPVAALSVETGVEISITGWVSAVRLDEAVEVTARHWASLGYELASVVETTSSSHPD